MSIHFNMHTINPGDYSRFLSDNRTHGPGEVFVILDKANRPAEMVFGNGEKFADCVRLRVLVWDQTAGSIAAALEALANLETIVDEQGDDITANSAELDNHEGRIQSLESGTGAGDVTGPGGGVVVGEISVYGSTTGKLIAGSGILLATITDGIAAAVTHAARTDNPHGVTKSQVGLANVNNTADSAKPVSTATQSALDLKQNLSSELTALSGLSSTGLVARTASATYAPRTITGTGGISVSNGNGVSGNPTISGSQASTTALGMIEIGTAAEFRTGTDTDRALGIAETWASAALFALTDGANIAVNMASGFNFGGSSNAPLALGGNRALSAPSNGKPGQTGILWFSASGATRTLTLNAAWSLNDGVEVGPYSIPSGDELGIVYSVRGTTVLVHAIVRRT